MNLTRRSLIGYAAAMTALAAPLMSQKARAQDASGTAPNPEHLQAVITLTLDDVRASQSLALSIAKRYNIQGTTFVPTAKVGDESFLEWDGIGKFAEAGWEVAAHTMNHLHLAELDTDEKLQAELEGPIASIRKELGIYPVSFASPFGEYDDRLLTMCAKYYTSHIGAWGGNANQVDDAGGYNMLSGVDHYRIGRLTVKNTDGSALIIAHIERAIRDGLWLPLLFHGFVDAEVASTEYETGTKTFETVLRHLSKRRGEGAIRVVTIADALLSIPHVVVEDDTDVEPTSRMVLKA